MKLILVVTACFAVYGTMMLYEIGNAEGLEQMFDLLKGAVLCSLISGLGLSIYLGFKK